MGDNFVGFLDTLQWLMRLVEPYKKRGEEADAIIRQLNLGEVQKVKRATVYVDRLCSFYAINFDYEGAEDPVRMFSVGGTKPEDMLIASKDSRGYWRHITDGIIRNVPRLAGMKDCPRYALVFHVDGRIEISAKPLLKVKALYEILRELVYWYQPMRRTQDMADKVPHEPEWANMAMTYHRNPVSVNITFTGCVNVQDDGVVTREHSHFASTSCSAKAAPFNHLWLDNLIQDLYTPDAEHLTVSGIIRDVHITEGACVVHQTCR